jgi:hypothetical protein
VTGHKNLFGRSYRNRAETVEYQTVRVFGAYLVTRRQASAPVAAAETVARYEAESFGSMAKARDAANRGARELARNEGA